MLVSLYLSNILPALMQGGMVAYILQRQTEREDLMIDNYGRLPLLSNLRNKEDLKTEIFCR
jgi:hypothetical protein